MKSAEQEAIRFILQPPGRVEDADIFHTLIVGEKALAKYIASICQKQREACAKAFTKELLASGDVFAAINVRDAILNAGLPSGNNTHDSTSPGVDVTDGEHREDK